MANYSKIRKLTCTFSRKVEMDSNLYLAWTERRLLSSVWAAREAMLGRASTYSIGPMVELAQFLLWWAFLGGLFGQNTNQTGFVYLIHSSKSLSHQPRGCKLFLVGGVIRFSCPFLRQLRSDSEGPSQPSADAVSPQEVQASTGCREQKVAVVDAAPASYGSPP